MASADDGSARGREGREVVASNPFWSERVREEARLRMSRPTSLPPLEDRPSLYRRVTREGLGAAPPMVGTMDGMALGMSGGTEMMAFMAGQRVLPGLEM